ncbi:amidohydrolase [uncultured Thiodictyon sp.]|jgi:predicted amidohydrolase YtcJ|uniref:amidohydrolase n=1 Tax=uncultured Thiodictyon sp. TaxID=1846217 RepID=UPI0025ED59FA|nr:amidohydrolase [uncultured Thiodictyon sp.]
MCIACQPGLVPFLERGAASRREFLRLGGALAAMALLPGSVMAAGQDSGPADTLFINGTIMTMDDRHPRAEAVAVRGGRILAVGALKDLEHLKGPDTQLVDLAGKTLMPGFVEPHMHFTAAFFDQWLDLGPFVNQSMDEVKAKLTQAVAAAQPGEWVMGQLFDPTITAGQLDVSRPALDALSPTIPLFILEANAHVAFANSAAFAAAGVTKDTADPPHGGYLRDAAGNLTGEIHEPPAIVPFALKAPHISGEQYVTNVGKLFARAAAKGCTTVHDCGIGMIDPKGDLGVLQAAVAKQPPVRVAGYLVSTAMDTWQELGLKPDKTSELLRINGVKAWVDGSNQGGSGYQREPYLIEAWGKGTPNYSQEALNAVVQKAHDGGWQVGIHAVGDAGIDMALAAFEAAGQKSPKHHLRHRIEHCALCHPDQLDRMKRLGVSPTFLIGHVYFYGAVFRDTIFGEPRANLIDPCRSALAKGLRISLHSDYSCEPLEPIRYIHNAVTRNLRGTTEQLNPAEAITVLEAIRAVTLDAAWHCHMDDIVGSIEVGKCADFVILDQDPTQVKPLDIIAITVSQTWMGGKRTYAA